MAARLNRVTAGRVLAGVLLLGLGVRVAILWRTSDLALEIADEQQYAELGTSLLHGRGFAWATGELTSLRPPLYPALVAAVWSVAGDGNLPAVRAVQIALSLLTAILVYELGRRTFNPVVGAGAAAATWLYPSLVYQDFTILTETLFTFLLVAFVLLAVMLVQGQRRWTALACGVVLGLGALTRSVLFPIPLVLCPLLVLLLEGPWRRRVGWPSLVFIGYALVVAPWAVRNTRVQGVVTIVDTMGGMNLRMGNYEFTPEDRMWDAVSLTGSHSWIHAFNQESHPALVTEGVKDKWAEHKALEYILTHPGTTLRRSVIKFGDFWGLERSFIAGVQQGLYAPPGWFVVLSSALILVSCATTLLLASAGLWLARPAAKLHLVLLVPVVVMTGLHSLVFGHSRYHLPLIPLLLLYAAALLQHAHARRWLARRPATFGAAALVLVLLATWTRQVFVVDAEGVRAFLSRMW
jgi:4-amino-4-deoxy-L-arabinose transferase-like glycosyltransferase